MPTRAGLLDLSTPKLVNDLLRSSLALRFSSMLWPWQLWLRDTPEQKFAPAVPHTHQRGACILRSFLLAPCSSTTQPNPGLPFRATKAGRYSDISRICAYGAPVQPGRPVTIKPTDRNLRSTAILHLRKPLVRAWLLRVRWYSRRQLAASGSRERHGVISWFEF